MKTVIDVCDIRHNFGEKVVLDKVNFKISKGEIFGLLGPSGAGKTTLIKILTGQLQPAAGESSLLGKASVKLIGNDYKKIGIMMDNFGLYERLNCYDNLKFYTMINGITKEKINEVLEKVGLEDARKTVVSNYVCYGCGDAGFHSDWCGNRNMEQKSDDGNIRYSSGNDGFFFSANAVNV